MGDKCKQQRNNRMHVVVTHDDANVDYFFDDNTITEEQFIAVEDRYLCTRCGCDFENVESHDAAMGDCCSNDSSNQSGTGTSHIGNDIVVVDENSGIEFQIEDSIIIMDDGGGSEETNGIGDDQPIWQMVDVKSALSLTTMVDDDQTEDASKSGKFFCFDCHSIFENKEIAEQHQCPLVETPGSDQNTKRVREKKMRRRPMNRTSDSDTYDIICHVCNTVFTSTKNLKFHMRIHEKPAARSIQEALPVGAHQQYNELDQFYCEICNKSFDQNLLAVHKQMHHNGHEQHMCGICNRQFESHILYQIHMKIHEEKKKEQQPRTNPSSTTARTKSDKPGFPCQYCGRVFMRPFEKVKHERVHTGEKPFSCEVCGKKFRVSYSLTLHLRTHTDIRPYVCTTCNKRFKSHQVYSHHLRIHSSERQYSCDECKKAFRTSVQLYAHKKTHTKPFQCVTCNRPFSSLYTVKTHMTTCKPGKFFCRKCGAEYSRPFALRLHMKNAHGEAMLDDDEDRLEKSIATRTRTRTATATATSTINNCNNSVDTDAETAVLIAAAANTMDGMEEVPSFDDNSQVAETFDVEDFHTEEIITDWLK